MRRALITSIACHDGSGLAILSLKNDSEVRGTVCQASLLSRFCNGDSWINRFRSQVECNAFEPMAEQDAGWPHPRPDERSDLKWRRLSRSLKKTMELYEEQRGLMR